MNWEEVLTSESGVLDINTVFSEFLSLYFKSD